METYINNKKVAFTPNFPLTWQSYFEKLLQGHIPGDHGIVKIAVDSQEDFTFLTEKGKQQIPEATRIVEIHTKDMYTICKDGFLKANSLIDSLKNEAQKTADLLREGKIEPASKKLIGVMEAIKPLIQFANSIGISYQMNFDQVQTTSGTSLKNHIEAFSLSLEEMIHAQEKKDYVELADYLEYQFGEDIEKWHRIIETLATEIELSRSHPQ